MADFCGDKIAIKSTNHQKNILSSARFDLELDILQLFFTSAILISSVDSQLKQQADSGFGVESFLISVTNNVNGGSWLGGSKAHSQKNPNKCFSQLGQNWSVIILMICNKLSCLKHMLLDRLAWWICPNFIFYSITIMIIIKNKKFEYKPLVIHSALRSALS